MQLKQEIEDTTKLFLIPKGFTVKEAMRRMSEKGEKELFVIDENDRLVGSLSDGDIRKWILQEGELGEFVFRICNRNPRVVKKDYDIEDVKRMMLKFKIESVPVVNHNNNVEAILIWDDVFAGKKSKYREKIGIPVVIMAGGKGARLDPFTRILPKPLIPIGDKPIIEIIMDKFSEYGVKDFYVSVNHKSKMIKTYFEDLDGKYNISYLEEARPLGTAGSLKLLEGRISDPFLVTNCDVIINSDYAELIRAHKNNRFDLTLVVCCRHYVIPYGVCEIEGGGFLKSIKEKPEYDLLINTGMYIMNRKILGLIPEGRFTNVTDVIDLAKAKGYKVGVYPVNEKAWIDVGQWEEYFKSLHHLKVDIGTNES